MNIAKFNKLLGEKIAKAKSFERNDEIERAIETWIEVSDLTLKASKQPDLDFKYKHMLINKTEDIINHVKDLKSKGLIEPIFEETLEPQKDSAEKDEHAIVNEPEDLELKNEDRKETNTQIDEKNNEALHSNPESIENNVKDTASNLKEIQAPKTFKIITPHDSDYVEKMKKLAQQKDTSIYQKKNKPGIDGRKEDLTDKLVCFECGSILPIDTKICPNCGAKLK
ncbi:MAG: zinc ribbon domain-containing protein [Promethearchaeota archaeon]|nr:MAG: zinc ribbon domain-containing protein [Candidatus Lokiarchaeota archaeon]